MSKKQEPFQLNFNDGKKIVSVTLLESEGIFELANLFKNILDEAGILCKITETKIEDAEQIS